MGPLRKPQAACLRLVLVALPRSPDMVVSGSRGTCGVVHFLGSAAWRRAAAHPAGLPSLVPAPSSVKGDGPSCYRLTPASARSSSTVSLTIPTACLAQPRAAGIDYSMDEQCRKPAPGTGTPAAVSSHGLCGQDARPASWVPGWSFTESP